MFRAAAVSSKSATTTARAEHTPVSSKRKASPPAFAAQHPLDDAAVRVLTSKLRTNKKGAAIAQWDTVRCATRAG